MIKDIIIFIFGREQKTRFKRLVLTVAVAAFIFVMSVNVSCGFDSSGKFYFSWTNIETKIELKK